MLKKIVSLLVVINVLLSCDTEGNRSPLPEVETLGSQVFSSGGVTLKGNINNLGDSEIVAYGFELMANGNNIHYNVNHQAELPASHGEYNLKISQGLYPDLNYNFRAYVRTESNTYRGETLTFHSIGSLTPVLKKCSPSLVHIGDTVVLTGENFPENKNDIELKFGDSYAEILSVSETELTFLVPKPDGDLRSLEISTYGKQVSENDLLDLYQPVISKTNPEVAFFGETISIIGDHFNNIIHYTSVYIGGHKAEIISTSRNEIQVVIPEEVDFSNTLITVYAQNQNVDYSNFNLKVPGFINVPDQVFTDDYFLVTVDKTYENKNTFLIGDLEYYPNIIDDTTLEFYINSSQTFDSREVELKWKINDLEVVSEQLLNIGNPYYKIKDGYNNNFPFIEYNVLTVNNEAVVIGDIAYTDEKKYIYKYDDVLKTWKNKALANNNGVAHVFGATGTSFVYSETTGFIYGLKSGGFPEDFVRVDIDTGNVVSLTPHNEGTYFGKGFSHKNKIYYTISSTNDLWAYNIDTQTWEVASILPYDVSQHRNLYITPIVVGDYVYIANGSNDSQFNEFWRMNLSTYQWEQLPDNPSPSKSAGVYLLNNKLHFVTTEIWKYDLFDQSWENMPNHGITQDPKDHGMDAFIQNNIPYIMYREDASNISYLNLFLGDLVD